MPLAICISKIYLLLDMIFLNIIEAMRNCQLRLFRILRNRAHENQEIVI